MTAAGYAVLFQCETVTCGGFDFRFGIDILAEPDMHVDLGDFRFLAAERVINGKPETLSLMISRSALLGFVQMTEVGGSLSPAITLTAASKSPQIDAQTAAPTSPEQPDSAVSPLADSAAAQAAIQAARKQFLTQPNVALLAQANQLPQNALQLLQ